MAATCDGSSFMDGRDKELEEEEVTVSAATATAAAAAAAAVAESNLRFWPANFAPTLSPPPPPTRRPLARSFSIRFSAAMRSRPGHAQIRVSTAQEAKTRPCTSSVSSTSRGRREIPPGHEE